MWFVCFSFDFKADSHKLLGLINEANFMGYLVAVFCLWWLTGGAVVEMDLPVAVVHGGWDESITLELGSQHAN